MCSDDRIEITIGSDEQNNYQILGKYVNPFHAKIYTINEQFYIEDLDSEFGTYVNNNRIAKPTKLDFTDRMSIGYHKIRLKDLIDNESNSVKWKDLIIPGRQIDKGSFRTLLLILTCYPIIVGFGVPTILILINQIFELRETYFELKVWEISPTLYWIFGLTGTYILIIVVSNYINYRRNTAGNNGEHEEPL